MRKMATLVQELTEEGAYDLDADPAVEGASEATWLDADSVSPALARDKKLAVRVQALERAIAARGDDDGGGPARAAALRRAILAPPLRPLRAALADATLSIADAARFLAGAAAALAGGARLVRGGRRRRRRRRRRLRGAAVPALRRGAPRRALPRRPFATTFAGAGRGGARAAPARGPTSSAPWATTWPPPPPRSPRRSSSRRSRRAATRPWRPRTPRPRRSPRRRPSRWSRRVAAAPAVAGAPSRGGVLAVEDLADLLRAARLGEFEATFAAEKVGVDDLVEARDAGDLGDLLADCGLKAGERARLTRELAKLRPVKCCSSLGTTALMGGAGRACGQAAAGWLGSLAPQSSGSPRARFSKPPVRSKAPLLLWSGAEEYGPVRDDGAASTTPSFGSALEQERSRRAAESRGVAWGCLPSQRGVPYHKRGRPAAKKRWRCALSLFRCCPRSRRRRARGSRSASARSGTPTRRRWPS